MNGRGARRRLDEALGAIADACALLAPSRIIEVHAGGHDRPMRRARHADMA